MNEKDLAESLRKFRDNLETRSLGRTLSRVGQWAECFEAYSREKKKLGLRVDDRHSEELMILTHLYQELLSEENNFAAHMHIGGDIPHVRDISSFPFAGDITLYLAGGNPLPKNFSSDLMTHLQATDGATSGLHPYPDNNAEDVPGEYLAPLPVMLRAILDGAPLEKLVRTNTAVSHAWDNTYIVHGVKKTGRRPRLNKGVVLPEPYGCRIKMHQSEFYTQERSDYLDAWMEDHPEGWHALTLLNEEDSKKLIDMAGRYARINFIPASGIPGSWFVDLKTDPIHSAPIDGDYIDTRGGRTDYCMYRMSPGHLLPEIEPDRLYGNLERLKGVVGGDTMLQDRIQELLDKMIYCAGTRQSPP